eukprot:scaffold8618_cov41-Prasinocladus_malaysianus.AAC.2
MHIRSQHMYIPWMNKASKHYPHALPAIALCAQGGAMASASRCDLDEISCHTDQSASGKDEAHGIILIRRQGADGGRA